MLVHFRRYCTWLIGEILKHFKERVVTITEVHVMHCEKLHLYFSFFFSILQIDDCGFIEFETCHINPWSASTMNDLLKKLNPQIMKYDVGQYSNFLLHNCIY